MLSASLVILALLAVGNAVPTFEKRASTSVKLGSLTFVNKGLVGFGFIPSDFKESTGDTLGGIGSAIALKRGTWKSLGNGSYTGTLIGQPDRGYNVIETIDYQARQHELPFTLTPYTGSNKLSYKDAQKTLQFSYTKTSLYFDRQHVVTSGLDPGAILPAATDPPLPLANKTYQHLSVDAEGLVLNADGTYWTSDEYGPYIYKFSSSGDVVKVIQPPAAILPNINGALNFTALVDPTTGRSANQGFEGLTVSPDGSTLYALLQSATIQDGGSDKTTSRYARLFSWSASTGALLGEWVVPLPQSSKGKTYAQSEIHYLSSTTFLVLARDGDGKGGDDTKSKYKQVDLFDISSATNIAGTAYDSPSTPVSPGGKLASAITPAVYTPFVNMIDDGQLGRFGLHNDGDDDDTLINAKWEGLTIAPVGDASLPDDYFVFAASDNDFQSTHGVSLGKPFNAGINVNNQFLVFQVTLPSVARGSVQQSIGI